MLKLKEICLLDRAIGMQGMAIISIIIVTLNSVNLLLVILYFLGQNQLNF
jgi:hypothetical protein